MIYGILNEYLSDFIATVIGNKVEVIGEVEELYKCPCCGYNTLNEIFDSDEGTGYDICPLCGCEDDGTTEIDEYRSINKGSIVDYRKKYQQIVSLNERGNQNNDYRRFNDESEACNYLYDKLAYEKEH